MPSSYNSATNSWFPVFPRLTHHHCSRGHHHMALKTPSMNLAEVILYTKVAGKCMSRSAVYITTCRGHRPTPVFIVEGTTGRCTAPHGIAPPLRRPTDETLLGGPIVRLPPPTRKTSPQPNVHGDPSGYLLVGPTPLYMSSVGSSSSSFPLPALHTQSTTTLSSVPPSLPAWTAGLQLIINQLRSQANIQLASPPASFPQLLLTSYAPTTRITYARALV